MAISSMLLYFLLILPVITVAEDEIPYKNYYKILGLKRDASEKQIKRAFRKLSVKYHPDKTKGDEAAHQRFLEINEAYNVIGDPENRQMYDIHGMDWEKKKNQPRGGGIFENFFGGGGGGGRGGGKKGRDHKMKLAVTLEDLYNGNEKSFSVKRKILCRKCRGTGAKGGEVRKCRVCKGHGSVHRMRRIGPGFNVQVQEECRKCGGKGKIPKYKCPFCQGRKRVREVKELNAIIEKGMQDKQEIRFERMAEQTPETLPGDVVLSIMTKRHPRFKREKNDLHHTMTINLHQSLLGFSKEILHLDRRRIEVSRKTITPHGYVMTMEGEGMPVHNVPSEKGDLHITFKVKFPRKLSSKQRKIIKRLLSK